MKARLSTATVHLLVGLLAFVCMTNAVFAQDPSDEGDITELEEYVVTGTKTKRLQIDVPVRTEIISSEDITALGATDLYEVLQGFPGIRVEQQCSACNFSQLRMQGLGADHTQVLLDGQPIYSGLASVYGLQQIPASNIERIEVVKGAGSALYGASTIAGVVNIITRQPAGTPKTSISLSVGEYNTNVFSATSSLRKGNADVVLTVQKNTGDEVDQDGDDITDRVKSDNVAIGAKMNWHDAFGGALKFSFTSLNEQRQGGELETFENPFAEGAEHIRTQRYEVGVGYERQLGSDDNIMFNITLSDHNRNATNDTYFGDYVDAFGTPPPADELEPYIADEFAVATDMGYKKTIGNNHTILAGALYTRNELEETGKYVDTSIPETPEPYKSVADKHADDFGIYLQDEWRISDKAELVLGARYDTHKSEDNFGGSGSAAPVKNEYDESSVNPRFALKYKTSETLTFRLAAGTGFRVPYGFSEDLHLCSGSPRVFKGSDLEPEKSVSISLGADYYGDRFTLSGYLFRTNLKDKIDFADADETARSRGYDYQWENIGDAYTQGVEIGSQVYLLSSMELDLSGTFTDAKYEEPRGDWVDHPVHGDLYGDKSEYLSRVPQWTLGGELSYKPTGWMLSAGVDVTGPMHIDYNADDDVESPDSYIKKTDIFAIVNTRVAKRVWGHELFLGAKNVFDQVQEERHPDDAAFIYAPLSGRIVYGGIGISLTSE